METENLDLAPRSQIDPSAALQDVGYCVSIEG